MEHYSRRVTSVQPSATVEVSDLAAELASQGRDIIDLSAGDPDFPTPAHIQERAIEALRDGKTHYTQSNGIPELREAIATKLQRENDVAVGPEQIVVTPGAKQGLFEALFALLKEDDEVVIFDPAWVSYEALVKMSGGRLNRVPLNPDTGFTLKSVDLSTYITDETQAIIVNTPTNPTGAMFSRANLETIRDLAVDHDAWVFSDEIYEKISYDTDHVSMAALDGMADRTVTINGFSKSHAMTGWRLGYYTAPDGLLEQANKVQSHTVTCATSFAQHGAVAALRGPQEPVEEIRKTFESRRDAAIESLREAGSDVPEPDGAFYIFVPVEADDDVAFCTTLLKEEGVAVTPGSAFGVSGYVRLSYAVSREQIREGIKRLEPYLE